MALLLLIGISGPYPMESIPINMPIKPLGKNQYLEKSLFQAIEIAPGRMGMQMKSK